MNHGAESLSFQGHGLLDRRDTATLELGRGEHIDQGLRIYQVKTSRHELTLVLKTIWLVRAASRHIGADLRPQGLRESL